ncbi:hypothetical protein EDB92DRAFT_1332546 [Lactarius akahatsu]|uniref:Uncharacterized protein n=1 Tax=Lactarius akahatsu TaxID=416441 RepID=A0AAD4LT61_9AGAM|nr:hypothetical protein EDB92DRAFT_1332546 [Lactarius akahatsu]
MFSKTLLVSLLVSAVVAAPAPGVGDAAAPPIIKLESNVSCTSNSVVASSSNPGPSPTVILLNSPSAKPSVASGYYGDYAAPVQPSVGPDVIKLNAPAGSLPIIKLNRRQLSPTSTSSFSFGGIVPSSTPALFSPLLSTTTPLSGSFGSTTTPPLSATTNPAVQGGPPTFANTGADGIETVFILSTVTVTATGPLCSSPPAVTSSGPAPGFPPPFSVTTSSAVSSNVPPSSPPSLVGVSAQAPVPVIPSIVTTSSLSTIDLNTPATPTPTSTNFSFSSGSTSNPAPTPFPVNAAAPANCDLGCLLTATL